MTTLNTEDRILDYLKRNSKRNKGFTATAQEIARFARVNYHTVRRILGKWADEGVVSRYISETMKCRVTKKPLLRYQLVR